MNTEKLKFIYLPFAGFIYIFSLWLIKIIPIPPFIQDSEQNFITFFIAVLIVALIIFLIPIYFLVTKISEYFDNVLVSGLFLVFLMSSYFFLPLYIFAKTPLLQNKLLIVYEYCGTNFNQEYRDALYTKNPYVCLNEDLYLNIRTTRQQSTNEPYCLTPTNRSIFISSSLKADSFKTSCISAMARDLNDIKVCGLIEENNLPYPSRYPYVGIQAGSPEGCIEDYNSREDRNLRL